MSFFKKITSSISLFFSKIFLFFEKYFWKKFKDKVLLRKILFTLSMMTLFVVIGNITLPGVVIGNNALSTDSFIGIMNTIGGGGLRQFSLVSLGISPFITASLVMTFAQTKLFPPIYRLYQSGPAGRIKINYITHALTFLFAIIQGIVIIQSLTSSGSSGTTSYIRIKDSFNSTWYVWIVMPFVLVAGTFYSIFIAEQITNKGVGNGSSMLILAGSIISLPGYFTSAWNRWIVDKTDVLLFRGVIYFLGFIIIFIVMLFIISFFYQAERRVPIQHIGVGRSKNIKDLSYLPIKLNPAGIMPIIFAAMLISFPMMIINLVNDSYPSPITRWCIINLALTKPIGLTIFATATFGITIFLSLQQAKIDKIVEDFNKNSTFIPGIRPGEQTEDYLTSIVLRLAIFSAFYLTILGSIQYLVVAFGVNPQLVLSGSSLMIVVTVSIETMQQIQARYKGTNLFGSRFRNKKNKFDAIDKKYDNGGSILW